MMIAAMALGGLEARSSDPGDGEIPPLVELLSPKGIWKVRATGDGALRIYEAGSDAHVVTLAHQGRIVPGLFGPGDQTILTVASGRVRIYGLPGGAPRSPVLHTKARHAEFTPSGGVVIVRLNLISFRDASTGRLIGESVAARPRHTFVAAVLDRKGARLVTTEDDGRTSLWDAATGRRLAFLGNQPRRAAFSPDGRWLVCSGGGEEPPVAVFDLGGLRPGNIVKLEPVCHAPYTPDGRRLALCDEDGIHFVELAPALARARGQ